MNNLPIRQKHTIIFLVFFGLSIFITWPLVLNFTTHVIGPFHTDNLEYVWKIWWVKHAIVDLQQSPFFVPGIYYPYGYDLALSAITPMHTMIGLPITMAIGPVASYNLYIFLSYLLGSFFSYLYISNRTKSIPAGIIGGVIFAFSPYHVARAGGTLNVVAIQWIPLYFLFIDKFIESKKPKHALFAGLAYTVNALSSWYYGFGIALLTPLYFIISLHRHSFNDQEKRRLIQGILLFGVTASVLVVPFLLPYFKLQSTGQTKIPLEQVVFWSASLTDYITPHVRHFLWGDWAQNTLTPFAEPVYEFIVTWGIVPSILALYGYQRRKNEVSKAWPAIMLVAFVISLGPALKFLFGVVSIPTNNPIGGSIQAVMNWIGNHSLAQENYLTEIDHVAFPLPGILLRWFVPGMLSVRSWARFSIFTLLGVALFAGMGVKAFIEDELSPVNQRQIVIWLVAVIFAGVILFEFYSGPEQLIRVEARPVDLWLAENIEDATIIQMPMSSALVGSQMFYSQYHQQNIASGYGTFFPIFMQETYPELYNFPDHDAINLLETWGADISLENSGVDYVLIDRNDPAVSQALIEQIEAQVFLKLITIQDGVAVYEIVE